MSERQMQSPAYGEACPCCLGSPKKETQPASGEEQPNEATRDPLRTSLYGLMRASYENLLRAATVPDGRLNAERLDRLDTATTSQTSHHVAEAKQAFYVANGYDPKDGHAQKQWQEFYGQYGGNANLEQCLAYERSLPRG
jgi:hypothetical protein